MRDRTSSPRAPKRTALLALALFLPAQAVSAAKARGQHAGSRDLGTVDFRVSCEPAVRGDFDRALGLLHHMMYEEARRVFEEITKRSPDCAMAHWGLAMTRFHPLWPARPSPEALKRGWEEVRRAMSPGPATDRERALVAAAEAFFRDPEASDYWTRIRRWAGTMEAAHRAHPADMETTALYALSQIALGQVAEDRFARNERAAELLLRIHEREPRHPGVIHYTIHANDADGRADESPGIVQSYGDIAPDVPHALHMPTHIFLRRGDWPEVIAWNRKSTDAALRLSPPDTARCAHYPHAPAYLLYAHLQRGEDEEAAEVLRAARREVLGKRHFQQEFVCAFHLAAMPAREAVEKRAWAEAAALAPRTPSSLAWDRYPWAEALTWFARGLGAVRGGDPAGGRAAEARMRELQRRAEAMGEDNWVRYIEIDRRILEGWLAHADGDPEEAVRLVRLAAELEKTVQKDPVTPGALLPANEALGDLLLELGRHREALESYEASLRAWPGRFNSLLGAARASRDAGLAARARMYYGELLRVVGNAPTTRPGVREARKVLAGK